MQQVNWFDRQFNFDNTQNIFPSIIERLSGTPIRLQEKLRLVPKEYLTIRVNNTWTIKENIGHLTDLEPLWQGRLQDILTRQKELRPTDLQNTKTTEAGHNENPLEKLLQDFATIRNNTINQLAGLTENQVFLTALHPRLKTPMRTMDLFLFVADHDDHHLARITELIKIAKGK
jgi:uncharacterized damage-inducible protein DinB